jgi:cardiolipin synthase
VFEHDLESGKRYTYETWQKRPMKEKFIEKFVLPIKSQL